MALVASAEKPFAVIPPENSSQLASRISFFFLPMARRSRSARPSEYPASCWAMAMTCSWYTTRW